MTLRLLWDLISDIKTLYFWHYVRNVVMDVMTFPENLQTTSGLSILLHGFISLPDATLCDKNIKYFKLKIEIVCITSTNIFLFWKCDLLNNILKCSPDYFYHGIKHCEPWLDFSSSLIFFCFYLILYVPSTIFQLCRDRIMWVDEPVLS